MGQQPGPQFSPDRKWWWDGVAWRPAVSTDGRWRWTGYGWVETGFQLGGLSAKWLALIAGAVVLAILAVTIPLALVIGGSKVGPSRVASVSSPTPTASPSSAHVANIPCDQLEHTQVHYHAFLQIISAGVRSPIPTALGRTLECFYWLHMHTNEAGIIHIESPSDRTFTLGDFFDVWSDWSSQAQPLDRKHVAQITLTADQTLVVYVDLGDGAGARVFSGDPRSIVLKDHELISLEITPPSVSPPPAFTWPPGF